MATINSPSTKSNTSSSGGRPDSGRPSWLWLALVPLLVAIPFLLRPALDAEQAEMKARRQRIENMSASERERLDKNFQQFQQLSDEQKHALRKIEESVREDENLQTTLLAYDRWLNTLSPWERAELRRAGTIDEKLAYVNTIAADRREEAVQLAERDKEWEEWVKRYLTNFQGPPQRSGGRSRVSETVLSNMMGVLESDYSSRVKPNPITPTGCAAYNIQLLAEALKASIQQNGLEEAREQPLPEETIHEMLDQIPDSDVRNIFQEYDSKRFVQYLTWKLEYAWWSEAKQNTPSREELDKIAKTLRGEALSKFEEEKESDPNRAYFHLLMATRPATFHADKRDLDDVMEKLGLRESNRRPTPGLGWPPFGGERRGDHRRGDRDRDRDRGENRNDDRDDGDHRRGKDEGENRPDDE